MSHQFEHVDLTSAQRFAADTLGQLGREMHGNTSLAGVHSADAIHQGFARNVFEQIAFRARLNGTVNIFIAVECGEHNDTRVLIAGANLSDRANSVEFRHSQIQEYHIWVMLLPKLHCFAAVGCLGEDGHVCFSTDE